MRHPWSPLTDWLSSPFGSSSVDAEADPEDSEAWTETASRLGLVRLGWRPVGREGSFDLAFPCERALVKADARGQLLGRRGPGEAPSTPGASEEATYEVADGVLVAAAPAGNLPPRRALLEVGTLAAAMGARRAARERLRRAERAAAQGRNAAAAAHDLRNELTRAVLHAKRDADGDPERVLEALESARDLAQTALAAGDADVARSLPRPVRLRELLVGEAQAALAAARGGGDQGPGLKVRCPKELQVLAPPRALSRALRNLLTNALEAAARRREGPGTVTLEARRLAEEARGLDVEIAVGDDGVGMGRAALNAFLDGGASSGQGAVPTHPARPDDKPGSTGLGTASLRLALSETGARLRVRSAPDAGTVACVDLRAVGGGSTTVVIDGDARRAAATAERLERSGREAVWVYSSGRGALRAIRAGAVAEVFSAVEQLDPEVRADLAVTCREAKVPLTWLSNAARLDLGRPLVVVPTAASACTATAKPAPVDDLRPGQAGAHAVRT